MAGTKAFPQENAVAFYAALALLMLFARGLGELARKLKQPAVLGEVSKYWLAC
jgi:Kef-type K+ transport system membrane component KefB